MSSSCWLLACGPIGAPGNDDSSEPCIEVVQYARPAAGGGCQRFATPCAVPEGYVVCCGGLGYGSCLGQSKCVDDPTDACNPSQSGADCTGICQP
ncbi:hypothetical protein DAT35_14320 [Vitiosangium sp. GDMCC 1.1324]|nr:hypothetical protein DAT35_14320 [Vitiosangium sp. GDMCC 1.1324]